MLKAARHTSGLKVCAAVALLLMAFPFEAARGIGGAARARGFEFEYKTLVKDIPPDAKNVSVWIPVPHDDPFQKISGLEIDSPYPYRIQTAEYGNKVLGISVSNPVQKSFTVTMRFKAVRREHVQERLRQQNAGARRDEEQLGPEMARWLAPDRLVPLDDKIRQWAREVVAAAGAHTDVEKARAIYDHIIATVKYDKTGKGWGRGDIYYACDARRGNCTDFHAIFIGYSRAVGIPARFSIGFPLPVERGAGQVSGYHCWAEFYLKGVGWVPVDASEAAKDPARREYFFGAHDENRVEFTTGRDLLLTPRQQGQPLNYFIYPYVEVDGKEFSSVEKTFSYRDLQSAPAAGVGR
ncbi:MAG TPA: transglutaminase domain-containing protein [Pyrinomonadaceae bacterium]